MPKGGRAYPPEFRTEAVELYRTSGRSIRDVSSSLGIAGETLRKWIKQEEIDKGSAEGLTTEERDELRSLRRQVKRLTMEREILKKAAAFFAKESDNR